MFKNISWLYAKSPHSAKTIYTSQPTNQIEISQIPISPKIFIEENSEIENKKKTLVFCDWSSSNWVLRGNQCAKMFIVARLLEELLDNNFTILLPTNLNPSGVFLEKKHLNFAITTLFKDIKPISFSKGSSEVALLIKTHNIPLDDLVFLDYLRLNKLLLEVGFIKNYEEGEVSLSDILMSNLDKNIIFKQLKEAYLPPTLIVNSNNFNYAHECLAQLKSFLPQMKIKIELGNSSMGVIPHLHFKQESISMGCYADSIIKITFCSTHSRGFNFLEKNTHSLGLKQLVELEVANSFIEELLPLFSNAPLLKNLTLTRQKWDNNYEKINNCFHENPKALNNITKLTLEQMTLSFSHLKIFLNQMPQLETLILCHCTISKENHESHSLTLFPLEKIKNFILHNDVSISQSSLQECLTQMPFLESFTLDHRHTHTQISLCEVFTEAWCASSSKVFQYLKSLRLNGVGIKTETLEKLLLITPSLEKLEIGDLYPPSESEELFTQELTKTHSLLFKKIKSLHLGSISSLSLQCLLKQTTSLERLLLKKVKGEVDEIWFKQNPYILNKLRELILGNKIDPKLMQQLIQQPLALEHLDLSEAFPLDPFFNKKFLEKNTKKFQSIKVLMLCSSNNIAFTQHLLGCFPALEELQFRSIDQAARVLTKNWLSSKPRVLPKLRKISCETYAFPTKHKENISFLMKVCAVSFQNYISPTLRVDDFRFSDYFNPQRFEIPLPQKIDPCSPQEDTPIRGRTEILLDANTEPTKINVNLNRIFFSKDGKHPEVDYYRLRTYRALHLNAEKVSPEKAFILNNKEGQAEMNLKFKPVEFKYSQEDLAQQWYEDTTPNVLYAKLQQNIGPIPQPLPSFSAHEELLAFHCSDPKIEYKIEYSERDDLHYICSKNNTAGFVFVDYLLKQPKTTALEDKYKLLQRASNKTEKYLASLVKGILKEAADYRKHGKAETLSLKLATGQEYIEAIIHEKKGACRHLAAAFLYQLQSKKEALNTFLGDKEKANIDNLFDFRIAVSGCHAWIEIAIKGEWFSCDLGGVSIQLTVNEANQPRNISSLSKKIKPKLPNEKKSQEKSVRVKERSPRLPKIAVKALVKQNFKPLFTDPSETSNSFPSVESYCHHLFGLKEKSLLIDFDSQTLIKEFIPLLVEYCHQESDYYFIDSADELSKRNLFFSVENKEGALMGLLQKGSGGSLHDFLTQPGEKAKILIINWANFTTEEIIQYNSLLDVPPLLHGEEIKGMKLLGLYNKNGPDAYQGNDFFDRWEGHSRCSFSEAQLKEEKAKLPTVVGEEGEGELIELYHAPEWKSLLLGQWQLEGEVFKYRTGPLLKGILEGRSHFRINHGLVENTALERFLQKIRLDGYISIDGYPIALPPDFRLSKTELPYEWERLAAPHRFVKTAQPQPNGGVVLNPHSFSYFFGFYTYLESNTKVYSKKGLLEAHSKQTLSLRLTRELTPHQWSRLLEEANRWDVSLDIEYPQDLSLPLELSQRAEESLASSYSPANLIITTDRDNTVAQLCDKMPEAWVVDASELSSTDVLSSLTCTATEEVSFTYRVSDIWQDLVQGKTVILSGNFSEELMDHLASLCQSPGYALINGKKEYFGGKLFLVTEEVQHGRGLAFEKDWVPASSLPFIKQKTLARLKAVSENPWEGMLSHRGLEDSLQEEDEGEDEDFCLALDKRRLQQVEALWQYSPYAFLAGKTGVGKTAFVKEVLATTEEYAVYYEEEALGSWLSDQNPKKKKILFIDEANLSTSQWSRYEGLFQTPPFILVERKRKEVSASHKVLFAGNPLSYGGERHLPSLFERHGASTVFPPLPGRYIAHRILRPLLGHLPVSLNQKAIKEVMMPLYTFILSLSEERVLITPRELEMMALLIMAYWKEGLSLKEEEELIAYSAYRLSTSLIPEGKLAEFTAYCKDRFQLEGVSANDWEQRFPLNSLPRLQPKGFILTQSRKGPFQQVEDFLAVRQVKQKASNPLHHKGGLGGIVLEGEPGEGKSYGVMEMLETKGFIHLDLDKAPLTSDSYYHLPASLSPKQKEACLLKAYATGTLVVMDEINSSPMMERLLNDMLMGGVVRDITPKPGFLLIGTQNSIARAGRKASSQALQRRMMQVNVPSYPPEELEQILKEKFGLEEELAHNLLSDYLSVLHSGTTSPPTPRKLFKIAENIDSQKLFFEKKEPLALLTASEKKSFPFSIALSLLGIGVGIFLGNLIMPGVGMLMGGVFGGLFIGGLSVSVRYFTTKKEEKPPDSLADDLFFKESYKNILNQIPKGEPLYEDTNKNLPSITRNASSSSFNSMPFPLVQH